MRGSVLLVLASLGLAAVGSTLLWLIRKITWRRPAPYLKQLEAVSPTPGRPVGPASGISRLAPSPEDAPPGDTPAVDAPAADAPPVDAPAVDAPAAFEER